MLDTVAKEDGRFRAICNFCGTKGIFEGSIKHAREQFHCTNCNASLRYRDQAAAILSVVGRGNSVYLDHLVKQPFVRKLKIWEAAIRGPFIRRFRQVDDYTQSYLFEDLEPGETRDGVICQDLEALTFDSDSFDLIISSDVMEHVNKPATVLSEIARVLRPGGSYVFSIPIRWPLPKTSSTRAKIENGELIHIQEPHYHRSGLDEKSLVFTDFGTDILSMGEMVGLKTYFFNSHAYLPAIHRFPCVIATKSGKSHA